MECVKAHFPRFQRALQGGAHEHCRMCVSCGMDIRQQCPDIKPGAGRILLCVKAHFAALSEFV